MYLFIHSSTQLSIYLSLTLTYSSNRVIRLFQLLQGLMIIENACTTHSTLLLDTSLTTPQHVPHPDTRLPNCLGFRRNVCSSSFLPQNSDQRTFDAEGLQWQSLHNTSHHPARQRMCIEATLERGALSSSPIVWLPTPARLTPREICGMTPQLPQISHADPNEPRLSCVGCALAWQLNGSSGMVSET